MHWFDVVGYLASTLVVLSFYMREMVPLRIAAMASNCAFLCYGIALGLGPVIALHILLLPLNIWRLIEMRPKRNPDTHAWSQPAVRRARAGNDPSVDRPVRSHAAEIL
jgi:hypothetical protein